MQSSQYPIGKYTEQPFSEAQRKEWLLDIQSLPAQLEIALSDLDAAQMETPYRDGGWTVRQLVHHVADSHMNAYIRMKFAVTEDAPTRPVTPRWHAPRRWRRIRPSSS